MEEAEKVISDSKSQLTARQARVLNVVVTSLPEAAPKSAFRDRSLMLSLAAFIFSVASGLYATVQSIQANRESTVDAILKGVAQYYEAQEKISQQNPNSDGNYISLLRSQQRAIANRIMGDAKKVSSLLDDGVWTGIAQIQGAQGNFSDAEAAWKSANNKATLLPNYLFNLMNLGIVEYSSGQSTAASRFTEAINLVTNDPKSPQAMKNPFAANQRLIQASILELKWVQAVPKPDCKFLNEHLDRAEQLAQNASLASDAADRSAQSDLQNLEANLDQLRERRTVCGGKEEIGTPALRFCQGVTKMSNAIRNGNTSLYLIGPPVSAEYLSNSRVRLPFASKCEINAFDFECAWPEKDDISSQDRLKDLEKYLASCTNLGADTVSHSDSSNNNVTETFTNHSFSDRPDIVLVRTFYRPTGGRSGHWGVKIKMSGPGILLNDH